MHLTYINRGWLVPGLQTKAGARSGRGFHGFQFTGAHELVTFHGHGDFELPVAVRFVTVGRSCRRPAAQDFAETTNPHGGICAGQRDQVFNAVADFDIRGRKETNAARTDIARLLRAINLLVTQLDNAQGELQPITLSAPLFHAPTVIDGAF